MIRYLSDRVKEASAGGSSGSGGGGGGESRRGICPVGGRLLVTGFLGESPRVRIPNSDKAVPRVTAREVVDFVAAEHGPSAVIMVWNLSGETYSYKELDDQVVEHALGLHPAPPLALLAEVVQDIVAWVDESEGHVAVVHDLSGRRSAVVAACCLMLMAENRKEAPDTGAALAEMQRAVGAPGRALVPSQVRYIDYFPRRHDVDLDRSLRLQRVIVNGIPDFVNNGDEKPTEMKPVSCTPFMKLIQGSTVIGGTVPGPSYGADDMCFSLVPQSPFPGSESSAAEGRGVGAGRAEAVPVTGDVLLRCYHQDTSNGAALPMFAVAFHTAFVRNSVLRVEAKDIDGAKGNGRFPRNFFVDLIFEAEPDAPQSPDAQRGEQRQGEVAKPRDAGAVPVKRQMSRKYLSVSGWSNAGSDRKLSAHSSSSSSSSSSRTSASEMSSEAPAQPDADDEQQQQKEEQRRHGKASDDVVEIVSPADEGDAAGRKAKGLSQRDRAGSDDSIDRLLREDLGDTLGLDLQLELDRYANEDDQSAGHKDGNEDLGGDDDNDDDDDDDFDIDAFASSLNLEV